MQHFPLYSLQHVRSHTRNCDDSEKAVAALPQEEFANICLLRKFSNFSVKPRWRPVVKHRQNVEKPSFCKLTMEMPVEVTPRTALSNFVRVRCEFFGQFRGLVRTKIRPSSIIIRLVLLIYNFTIQNFERASTKMPWVSIKENLPYIYAIGPAQQEPSDHWMKTSILSSPNHYLSSDDRSQTKVNTFVHLIVPTY